MKLKNIKASFIFDQNLIEEKSGTEKFIFKEKNVTYTIYKHTPHLLNVTGVKSIAQLLNCKSDMEERFNEKIIQERVDNLFFSKKDNKSLDMDQLCHYLKENELRMLEGTWNQNIMLSKLVEIGFLILNIKPMWKKHI